MAEPVRICEVAPRDGLQYESRVVPTADKVRLVDLLSACGFAMIETASMVSPARVPQMADGEAILAGITRRPGCRYTALTPNLRGYQRARAAGADCVAVFISASEGFSRANINCTRAESLERVRRVIAVARGDGITVRGYISCVVVCPFDGPTPPAEVARLAGELLSLGCDEVSLGDTIGAATPEDVERLLGVVLGSVPAHAIVGHFHDTGARALENIEASLAHGIRSFDASAGGLGGCPFAPGAQGNVDTRDVVRFLAARGFETGIDEARLADAARFAESLRQGDP